MVRALSGTDFALMHVHLWQVSPQATRDAAHFALLDIGTEWLWLGIKIFGTITQ